MSGLHAGCKFLEENEMIPQDDCDAVKEVIRQELEKWLDEYGLWMPMGMLSSKDGKWTSIVMNDVWKYPSIIAFLHKEIQQLLIAAVLMKDAFMKAEKTLAENLESPAPSKPIVM